MWRKIHQSYPKDKPWLDLFVLNNDPINFLTVTVCLKPLATFQLYIGLAGWSWHQFHCTGVIISILNNVIFIYRQVVHMHQAPKKQKEGKLIHEAEHKTRFQSVHWRVWTAPESELATFCYYISHDMIETLVQLWLNEQQCDNIRPDKVTVKWWWCVMVTLALPVVLNWF